MKITPYWGESPLTQHHLGGMSALTTFSVETRRQVKAHNNAAVPSILTHLFNIAHY